MTDEIKAVADNVSVSKAIATCGKRIKVLYYLQESHYLVVKKNKTEFASAAAMTAISDTISMAKFIEQKREDLLPKLWDGTITEAELDMLQPDYFNFQDSLAEKALQDLDENLRTEKLSNIVMIYDINEKSEFVRGYLSKGKPLNTQDSDDKKVINVADQAFHSWLVSNGMSSQNGVIYMNTPKDKKGNPIKRADPKTISSLLSDNQKGLDAMLKKHDTSFSLEVRNKQDTQPKQQQINQQSPSVKASVDDVSEKIEPISQKESPRNDVGPDAASVRN